MKEQFIQFKCSCFRVIPWQLLESRDCCLPGDAIVIGGLMANDMRQVLLQVHFLRRVQMLELRFLRFYTGKKLDRYSFKQTRNAECLSLTLDCLFNPEF